MNCHICGDPMEDLGFAGIHVNERGFMSDAPHDHDAYPPYPVHNVTDAKHRDGCPCFRPPPKLRLA